MVPLNKDETISNKILFLANNINNYFLTFYQYIIIIYGKD
jgi:hypothetical protein